MNDKIILREMTKGLSIIASTIPGMVAAIRRNICAISMKCLHVSHLCVYPIGVLGPVAGLSAD